MTSNARSSRQSGKIVQLRKGASLEMVRLACPDSAQASLISESFGLPVIDSDGIRDLHHKIIVDTADSLNEGLGDRAMQIHLQRIVGSYVAPPMGPASSIPGRLGSPRRDREVCQRCTRRGSRRPSRVRQQCSTQARVRSRYGHSGPCASLRGRRRRHRLRRSCRRSVEALPTSGRKSRPDRRPKGGRTADGGAWLIRSGGASAPPYIAFRLATLSRTSAHFHRTKHPALRHRHIDFLHREGRVLTDEK